MSRDALAARILAIIDETAFALATAVAEASAVDRLDVPDDENLVEAMGHLEDMGPMLRPLQMRMVAAAKAVQS